jgi:hypothetical protein
MTGRCGRGGPGVLLAVLVALLTGCGISPEGQPRALDPTGLPRSLTSAQAQPETVGSQVVRVFLVRDQELVPVMRSVPDAPTVTGLMDLLNQGPTGPEGTNGLTSAVPAGATVSVLLVGGIARVTVPAGSRLDETLGFGQIVLTLNESARVTGVVFQRDGKTLDVPAAGGAISAGPFTAADFTSLVATD